jgi:glycerate kinase
VRVLIAPDSFAGTLTAAQAARAAAPSWAACSRDTVRNNDAMSSAVRATRISVSGAKKVSMPSQASVTTQAAQPAASKTRVGGL